MALAEAVAGCTSAASEHWSIAALELVDHTAVFATPVGEQQSWSVKALE